MLEGKKIVLGVCGSIAAYKAATLVRLLVKAGANVKVVMTADAVNFITPLTLATLSKNPVLIEYFNKATGVWNNHVELGLWADLFVIAPASANTLAKMSNGQCDNLLTAAYLSAKCPVYFAPAMDLDMWQHPATTVNVKKLQEYGNILIQPGTGELASGLHGEGRMAEPEEIVSFLQIQANNSKPLSGKTVLVTAGPTYEAIDPVRFIGNHSSGKMGFAIAAQLANRGAKVMLVTGPTAEKLLHHNIERIDVVSAHEMLNACVDRFSSADICVMSAAVADYTPLTVASQKIKKQEDTFCIDLKKTTDILKVLGESKKSHQLLIGFALETQNEEQNAIDKLRKKNLDLIILNSLNDSGAGFKLDTNKITTIDSSLQKTVFDLKSKDKVAADIADKIVALL
ncbi:bifunctional phosphopantothenoylcysteine decarboxylase/phosphopantothenate--cysteine ligase CoaBC [uncultured Mucilaginibacter sp.]|uniref:bifunctional phosphopantothenoylcysteine decarboxylase/phosphopantothenate--cysteine ligase CoaBC n=1 Tax=uncultured Mucilaginibacter sp. TaxID=797541 RepID=UPI0025E65499|nr:bifunctional phosphopantothenoylcysteine decarboxylase/phosphopantothenate--cysteine ligase CoaBC [uncultured Mucilaginibacter sp.]